MTAIAGRREKFEHLAARLIEMVIQPRLEILAGYLSNASLPHDEPSGHRSCWFGYCQRFPASTKVAFAVEHDARLEKVAIGYEVINDARVHQA
jgi:hypothetical protein